jgi:hypothetical protein
MDDVQVDALDPEPLEAALNLCDRVSPRGMELGSDEHVIARDTALAQSLPDGFFVPVGLGGVDVPVAEFERPAHGVDALASVRHLPDAEAEQRKLRTVGQGALSSICSHGAPSLCSCRGHTSGVG